MTKILVIEDDVEINNLIKETLIKDGYQVTCAYSGTEGRLILKDQNFDLILLDLMLPGVSGESLLKEIHQELDLPIIVVSAKGEIEGKVQVLESGADDYLVKPFDLKELLARVQTCLRRSKAHRGVIDSTIYQHDGLKFDPINQVISYQDQEIILTPQERKILEILLKHPQKIFTKNELFELAWQDYYVGEDNTINVHISNLRRKLMKHTGKEFIETVWGIGFRLAKPSL